MDKLSINYAKLLPWTVGPKARQKVTMGFKVSLELPELSKKDKRELQLKRKVDSLLVEIKRRYKGHMLPIGAITVPIEKYKDEVYFTILYFAASIRPMFTDYICVPYNLSYLAKSIKIKGRTLDNQEIFISTSYEKKYLNETMPFTYNNQSFISGKNLAGDYYFRFAFFDSINKELKSAFYDFPNYVSVDDETKVDIIGCSMNTGDGIIRNAGKKYKWKR